MAKKKDKPKRTAKISGAKITRDGKRFTLTWKIKAKNSNDGQYRRVAVNGAKKYLKGESKKSIPKKATSTWIDIDGTKRNLNTVLIEIQDDQDKVKSKGKVVVKDRPKSGWTGKTFTFSRPPKPIASMGLTQDYTNICSVSWNDGAVNNGNGFNSGDKYYFKELLCQTTFHSEKAKDSWKTVKNKQAIPQLQSASSIVKKESGSMYWMEDSATINNKGNLGYVRKFRFAFVGTAGSHVDANKKQTWTTVAHYYAKPYAAKIKWATISKNGANGLNCTVKWTADTGSYHPIDRSYAQYAIAVPGQGMTAPSSGWTNRPAMNDTTGEDADSFSVDGTIGLDECLFVRVVTEHDSDVTYSSAKIATGVTTTLTSPSGLSIPEITEGLYRVLIQVTNASQLVDSKLAIIFRGVKNGKNEESTIKILNYDSQQVSETIQCPNWSEYESFSFGVYAFYGSYSVAKTISYNVEYQGQTVTLTYNTYNVSNVTMKSATIWQGGDVPKAPAGVTVTSPREGVATVTWEWTWAKADIAELSWSDQEDAWESTEQPDSYRISSMYTGRWNIHGLASGVTWYIRVRLIKTTSNGETVGPWSNTVPLGMSSVPNVPVLEISKKSVTLDDGDKFTLSWNYESNDGTNQKDAIIKYVTLSENGTVLFGEKLQTSILSKQSIDLSPKELGWASGQKYGFAIQVISEMDEKSDWSDPQFITVADPLKNLIVSSSIVSLESVKELKAMPLNLVISTFGGSENGSASILGIERTIGYFVDRPDESTHTGYAGENIFSILIDNDDFEYSLTSDETINTEKEYFTLEATQVSTTNVDNIRSYYENVGTSLAPVYSRTTDTEIDETKTYFTVVATKVDNPSVEYLSTYYEHVCKIVINNDDLLGTFDDTADYKVTLLSYDDLDQTDYKELPFTVNWTHQAGIPSATAELDPEFNVMKITPTIDPEKYEEGDTVDIYRLSVDKPVLIVKGGTFGTTYVDPYPTIGPYGGHRIVTVTANGDFIANESEDDMAWIDLDEEDGDIFNYDASIINYDGGTVDILYNVDLSSSWKKDFKETKYLGGHIQGDWNPAVSRTSSINSVVARDLDQDTIVSLRRIADYPGICHVRTLDGSNYYADVQISESISHDTSFIGSYTFNITRVDNSDLDGVSLDEWRRIISNNTDNTSQNEGTDVTEEDNNEG